LPRGIKGRNTQELRSKPRFLPLIYMRKAGQAAGYSSSRESGINPSEVSMIPIMSNQLSRLRGQILGWGLSLGLLAGFMTLFYDTIAEQKENYLKLMAGYPKEMLAFFSTGSVMELFTPSGYLNLEFFSYMTIVIGIFVVLAGGGLLAGDEENGTLDLILAYPVSRSVLFVGRMFAFLMATIAILVLTWIGFAIVVPGTMMDLTPGELALPLVSLFGILMIFGSLALLFSMLLPSQRLAAMTSGIVMVASYFINAMSKINDDLEPVAKLLPFRYYLGGMAIDGMNWGQWAVMLGISALFVVLAWWRFEQRDIRVGGEGGWGIPFLAGRRPGNAAQA
jgi:ABC-2 type transport system permease protein